MRSLIPLRKFLGTPVLWYKRRELTSFLALAQDAQAAQAARLMHHLAQIDGSAFATDHGLCGIRTSQALRKAIPIGDYDRMAPYVARVEQGETSALFRPGTEIVMLAQTSGTTSAAKSIPVTLESIREYKRSWTIWGCALAGDHADAPFAAALSLASHWSTSIAPCGIPKGSISGLLSHLMEGTLGTTNVLPSVALQTPSSEARQYLAMRLALARDDLMVISTANPSTLINFARNMDAWKDRLIRDLHDGSLSGDERDYPAAVRKALRARLARPAKRRARDLWQSMEKNGGRLYPKDAWPLLSVLGVWTGGTLAPYLRMLPTYYGAANLRDHGLSASEGRMSIPLRDGDPSGVLNVASCYYEFIPAEDYGKPNPATLEAHQLDVGGRYYIVITTSGGLVRYDLADLIEVTGHVGVTPLIRFLNKGSQFGNVTGEKLSAHQVTNAMARVQEELGIYVDDWSVAPVFGDPPRYHLLLDERHLPPEAQRALLVSLLDLHLTAMNVEYADKRRSQRLGPPILTPVKAGTFAAWRAHKLALGSAAEQYKHPFIVNDPDVLASLGLAPGIGAAGLSASRGT